MKTNLLIEVQPGVALKQTVPVDGDFSKRRVGMIVYGVLVVGVRGGKNKIVIELDEAQTTVLGGIGTRSLAVYASQTRARGRAERIASGFVRGERAADDRTVAPVLSDDPVDSRLS